MYPSADGVRDGHVQRNRVDARRRHITRDAGHLYLDHSAGRYRVGGNGPQHLIARTEARIEETLGADRRERLTRREPTVDVDDDVGERRRVEAHAAGRLKPGS